MAMTATPARSPAPFPPSAPARSADDWPRLAMGVLDLLPEAVLVVARDLQLLGTNRSARRLLREGDGLATSQRSLIASTPVATCELRRGIERAAYGEAGALRVPREQRSPLALRIEAHPAERAGVAATVVFATDPERSGSADARGLELRYGFTPAESEVAQRLAAGSSLEAIAQALGVTLHTVRGHLKHVYVKAGVHRQAELVARLLCG